MMLNATVIRPCLVHFGYCGKYIHSCYLSEWLWVYELNIYNGTSYCLLALLLNLGHDSLMVIKFHYNDIIISMMASQITSLTMVYSSVYSGAHQRKHQSTSLDFVRGIHQWPVNSAHKGPVTRKIFPFDDIIMIHLENNSPITRQEVVTTI